MREHEAGRKRHMDCSDSMVGLQGQPESGLSSSHSRCLPAVCPLAFRCSAPLCADTTRIPVVLVLLERPCLRRFLLCHDLELSGLSIVKESATLMPSWPTLAIHE